MSSLYDCIVDPILSLLIFLLLYCHDYQKLLGVGESLDVSSVMKGLCEHHGDVNKKYIVRICDAMTPLFTGKKR